MSKRDKKRFDIIKKVVKDSERENWIDKNQPSWVVKAFMGAGILATVSIGGCCSSKQDNTTVNTPPPRKEVADTKPVETPKTPDDNKPSPKPLRPIDVVKPLYGI